MADGLRAKGLKPSENTGKQGRRALHDLSNVSKGTGLKDTSTLKEKSQQKPRSNVTNSIKGTALKDKPILKEKSTQKQRSEALKNPLKILTDAEIKMCHEWAKDGVEGFHSTQNDSQKLDKDLLDKRMIMIALANYACYKPSKKLCMLFRYQEESGGSKLSLAWLVRYV